MALLPLYSQSSCLLPDLPVEPDRPDSGFNFPKGEFGKKVVVGAHIDFYGVEVHTFFSVQCVNRCGQPDQYSIAYAGLGSPSQLFLIDRTMQGQLAGTGWWLMQ